MKMEYSSEKPTQAPGKNKTGRKAGKRCRHFPDRALGILRDSPNPLFRSADLAWVIVTEKGY
jgi:hypothetical protein